MPVVTFSLRIIPWRAMSCSASCNQDIARWHPSLHSPTDPRVPCSAETCFLHQESDPSHPLDLHPHSPQNQGKRATKCVPSPWTARRCTTAICATVALVKCELETLLKLGTAIMMCLRSVLNRKEQQKNNDC